MMEIKIEKSGEKEKDEKPDEWCIKNWVSTVVEAEEIKNDPAKMKYVKPLLADKVRALKKITSTDDLRKIAKKMPSEDEDE